MHAPSAPPCRVAPASRRRASCARALLPACAAVPAARAARAPRHAARRSPPALAAAPEPGTEAPPAEDASSSGPRAMPSGKAHQALGKGVNLFDPAATISRFLTRRFGIVGGLAFVALLASTEGAEIVNALREELTPAPPVSGEAVTLPSGVVYRDVKIGGGGSPNKGDFVGVHLRVTLLPHGNTMTAAAPAPDAMPLIDTRARNRPIAFVFRAPRRPGGALCAGLEDGLQGMKRGGVRIVDVPALLGPYGGAAGPPLAPDGASLPANAALRYEVTLEEVSPAYM